MHLIVSIHDVSPRTRPVVEAILGDLHAWGVEAASLLVIPDHHHGGAIAEDAAFCEWLRGVVAAGHEAVLHGCFHQRTPRGAESVADKVVTQHYTAGEGEFYDLSRSETDVLLARGLAQFEAAGLPVPSGFIAPAWLLGAEAEEAVRTAGFQYTVRLREVLPFASGQPIRSQSLCWSVRSGWRRTVSLAWNAFLFSRLRANRVLRISIHPPDKTHPRIWHQIGELTRGALSTREPITYARLVAAAR